MIDKYAAKPSNKFDEEYQRAFSLVKCSATEEELRDVVENTEYKGKCPELQKMYFRKAATKYLHNDFCITNFRDKNGRIHHTLTNTPKEFRQFLNVGYSLDIGNCQPLLLVPLLYKYYGISEHAIEYLYNSIVQDDTFKLASKYSTSLTMKYTSISQFSFYYEPTNEGDCDDSEIRKEIKKLPNDVLKYIYICCHGIFWDELVKEYHVDRKELKEILFQEVFYSNAVIILPDYNYAKLFKKAFPNVMKAILAIRKAHGTDDNGKRNWLPNQMQKVESRVMRKVIECLQYEGYDVISIHDEVILLDTDRNESHRIIDVEWGEDLENVEYDVYCNLKLALREEGLECSFKNWSYHNDYDDSEIIVTMNKPSSIDM